MCKHIQKDSLASMNWLVSSQIKKEPSKHTLFYHSISPFIIRNASCFHIEPLGAIINWDVHGVKIERSIFVPFPHSTQQKYS